jgi:translation initiation factor IF-2
LLISDVAELKANPNRPAQGMVIEAQLDKGRGPLATILVQKGTLKIGDSIVVGNTYGKVRAMSNHIGQRLKEAGPSVPVEVIGLADVPQAGDIFNVLPDERVARVMAGRRQDIRREEELRRSSKVKLDEIFKKMDEGEVKELNLVLKADVQGSVEALKQSLERLSTDEVRVNCIHTGVGAITESDVMLDTPSIASIIGYNYRQAANTRKEPRRKTWKLPIPHHLRSD